MYGVGQLFLGDLIQKHFAPGGQRPAKRHARESLGIQGGGVQGGNTGRRSVADERNPLRRSLVAPMTHDGQQLGGANPDQRAAVEIGI